MGKPTQNQITDAARLTNFTTGPERYRLKCEYCFGGLNLSGKRVLDVGCGNGYLAIWAGLCGASHVVGLEPEAEGSTNGTLERFRNAIQELSLSDRVHAQNGFLQDLDTQEEPFDVLVMYNVINHLDEEAVMAAHCDPTAFKRYVEILVRIKHLIKPNAWLIVADAGRSNLWNSIGLQSPFARTIEWNKHQDPHVWERILKAAGYEKYDLRWTPMRPLGWLTANRLGQFCTRSHFCMRFKAA